MLFVDSHCDTPSQIYRLRDIVTEGDHAHVDFPKMHRGGVGGAFFSLYTSPGKKGDEPTRYALELIAGVYDAIERSGGAAALTTTAAQCYDNHSKGIVSVFLGMENGSPIRESLPLLRLFYQLGVRYVTLTHNGDNALGDSCAGNHRWHGLSPFGKEAVAEMNRLGIMVDLSHASDETFWDCIRLSKAPVIASHSGCRSLCRHRRNLTDEMIRALGEKGGYIGIPLYPAFLSDAFNTDPAAGALIDEVDAIEDRFIAEPWRDELRRAWYDGQDRLAELKRPGVKEIVDHIAHAISLAGKDHVGIGTDFDGISVLPEGFSSVSDVPLVFSEMRRRGFSEDVIEGVAGKNLLAVLERVSNPL